MNYRTPLSLCQLLLVCSLLICHFLPAVAAEEKNLRDVTLFEQANRNYSQGNYLQAATLYEEIISHHGLSAPLLYNLGNSYKRNDQPGPAILSYLRALRLSPDDSDIKGNLQLVRKEQGLFQPEQTWMQQFTHLLEMDQWCLAAVTTFGLLTLLHLLSFFTRINSKSLFGFSTLLLSALLTFSLSTYSRYQDYHNGVITSKDVHLHISPFQTASSTGKLKEGQVVNPAGKHGDFYLVQDETGRKGWLHKNNFALIVINRNNF